MNKPSSSSSSSKFAGSSLKCSQRIFSFFLNAGSQSEGGTDTGFELADRNWKLILITECTRCYDPSGIIKVIYLSIYLSDRSKSWHPAQYDKNSHMHVSCLCSDWYHEQNPWQLCSRAKNNSTVTKHTADYMFTTMDQCGVRKEYVYSGCGGSNCLFFWLFLLWNIQMDQFKPDFH